MSTGVLIFSTFFLFLPALPAFCRLGGLVQHSIQRIARFPHRHQRICAQSGIRLAAARRAKQLRDIETKSLRQPPERVQRRALLPSLDFANELVGQPRARAKLFLAPPALRTKLDDSFCDPPTHCIHIVEYSRGDCPAKPPINPCRMTSIGVIVVFDDTPAAHDPDGVSAETPTRATARRPTRSTLVPCASNIARGSLTFVSPRRTAPS